MSASSHMHSIATLMTPFPHSVTPETTVAEAQMIMSEGGFRHLPVLRNHEVVGLLSARDLDVARLLVALEAKGEDEPTRVGALCARPVFSVDLHASLGETLRTMAKEQFGSAVVTREGRLAGIITSVDVCRALADFVDPPTDDDHAA